MSGTPRELMELMGVWNPRELMELMGVWNPDSASPLVPRRHPLWQGCQPGEPVRSPNIVTTPA